MQESRILNPQTHTKMKNKTTITQKNLSVSLILIVLLAIFSTSALAQNSPPTPSGDSYSGAAARGQAGPGVLTNDTDPDGDSLSVGAPGFPRIVTQAQNGTVTMNFTDGSFSYSPNPGYLGNDSFVYNSCDSQTCTPATVTLITPNSAPVGGGDSYTGIAARGQFPPNGLLLLANDSDPNGDQIQPGFPGVLGVGVVPKIATPPSNGTLTMQFSDGSFAYTPNFGYTGDDSFAYNLCDNYGACVPITVNLIKPNSAPVTQPDFFTTKPGKGLSTTDTGGDNEILKNDSDPDEDPIRVGAPGVPSIITPPQNGNVTFPFQGGEFIYGPNPGFSGLDFFVYNVCDSLGACSIEFAYIFVTAGEAENAGRAFPAVGCPINVTNGNMWLNQIDYNLPGIGQNIQVDRFYNTTIQEVGLFGLGWSTAYDESLTIYDSKALSLNMPDGRAINFGRTDDSAPYTNLTPDFYGELVKNPDDTYTLTFKEGMVHQFRSDGKLLWQRDRDGNQTTLNYDTGGNLTGITDTFGRTLNVTVINDKVSQISDSIGIVANYVYNPDNTLQTVTYADNSKYQFEYTTVGGRILLTTVKDALNNILETHQYNAQGRATTSEKDGGVEKYTFNYDAIDSPSNPYTTVTDALGRTTKYTFDKSNRRNVVTEIEGNCNCGSGSETITYEFDDKLNLTKQTDALNNQITYTYDAEGNRLTMTDVLGFESYTYNSFGQVLTATDRMGGVTTNNYDPKGNLLATTDAVNATTNFTYTPKGQLATVTNARNATTSMTYDAFGRLTKVADALTGETNYAYDARARLTSLTNALTRVTAFEYDPANRLNKITYPTNKVVQYGYDLAGRRTSVTDERNFTTNFAYDNAYRLITVTDPLSHTVNYSYDLMSNLVSQTDGEGNVTNYEYDTFDRLTKTVYPIPDTGVARLEERFEYDAVGNLKKRIDTANRQTVYNYDNAYRLTNTVDALNQITQFQYNPRSQMVKVIDAKGQNYDFTYDPLGRQLTQTRDGGTMTYQYDLVGNRTRRTDYKGDLTRYTYDPLNRLKRIIYPNAAENVQYNYDKLSRLQKAIDETGTVDFNYTQRDQVSSVLDVHGQKVGYSYDAAGNRRFLRLNDVDQFDHRSDSANRLQKIIDKQNSDATIDFNYDSANRMTRIIRPNGVDTVYRYDGMSRLTVLRDFTVAAPTPAINHRAVSYNTASQISNITNKQDNRTFNYDNIDRLTGVTGSVAENYAYDQVGNRTSSHQSATYSTAGFNKLTATANATYTYDANGNMTSKVDTAGTWTYEWDFENRLKKVTNPSNEFVEYRYDGLGRRVERLPSNGVSTKFVYDGMNVFVDQNSDGSSVKYINSLSIDNKLGQVVNGTTSHFLKDHLGSTNNILDSSGTSVESTTYDAFGKAATNLSTRYQYTGREYDEFSGLHYYRARWFDSNLGRFISEDPIGLDGGINLYGYVNNRPLSFRDPNGEHPAIVAGVLIGAAALILTSPSYVNAPAPCDPVYRPENPLLLNAALGAAGGAALQYLGGKVVGGLSNRLIARSPVKVAHAATKRGGPGVVVNRPLSSTGNSNVVGRALDDLSLPYADGSGRAVKEVFGNADDALAVFNKLRGTERIRMVKPGVWITKSASGNSTLTFRYVSKSGPPTIDLGGLVPGIRKLKFVN